MDAAEVNFRSRVAATVKVAFKSKHALKLVFCTLKSQIAVHDNTSRAKQLRDR